jgi:hypothetical protein
MIEPTLLLSLVNEKVVGWKAMGGGGIVTKCVTFDRVRDRGERVGVV